MYIINKLWIEASNKKFGFTPKIHILNQICKNNNLLAQHILLERLQWNTQPNIIYSIDAPIGHLPTIPMGVCFYPKLKILGHLITSRGWFAELPSFVEFLRDLEPQLTLLNQN